MRKKSLVLMLLSVIALSGCGGYDEVNELRSLTALNSESTVTNKYSLSWSDEQNMVYAQVSNRQLLDLSTLDACTDNEIQQVINYMSSVDGQLTGTIDAENGVIDKCFTDYLLAEFEKTPYYWQRSKTVVRGIDAESRSIIVDVQYKTIDFEKDVKPDSTIILGEPNYQRKLESRFTRWNNILNLRMNQPTNPQLPVMEYEFITYFGNPEDIIEEQRSDSPTDAIFETGNQTTYTGLINSEEENTGATMTVRYVLVPNYVLGVNLGITCQHMYITEYNVDSDCTEGLSLFVDEGYATVTDSVYQLIYSYFTCIDESDFNGLYKLTRDFGSLDKYYKDKFETTYIKHNGFAVSLFDITGTHITCGVEISSKERAKGSNMTMPIYTDRYYVELELDDGTLVVDNMVLLSRRIEGEPAIKTNDADLSGFVASIDLDNDDKLAIEKLICDFSALQLLGDTTSDDFSSIVDISISTSQLSTLQSNMSSMTGAQKVVWLQNYQQGTSNYASVKCRELYQDASNAIIEATATYDFIMKGGRWYVYSYDINSQVRLDTTNLSTTNSLCLVSPGEVVAYTSQVQSTVSTNVEEISDTSVSFDHKEYTPVLKSGSQEQGLVILTGADVDEDIFNETMSQTSSSMTYEDFLENCENLKLKSDPNGVDMSEEYQSMMLNSVAVLYNVHNGRYDDSVIAGTKSTQVNSIKQTVQTLNSYNNRSDADLKGYLSTATDALNAVSLALR